MKIIQVIPHLALGGAETMCENLVYELIKMGHEVIVVSMFNKQTAITDRLEKANVDLRYLDKKDGFDLSLFKKFKKIFREEKPDIIHTHLNTAKYVFPIASHLKIKVVHTIHSVATKESSKFSRKFNKIFFKRKKAIPVALSENIQETIVSEYKMREEEVPVAYNGSDLTKCIVKTNYEIKDKFKIVHVGGFREVKNHVGLVEAFDLFHKKCPNSELHLIGDGVLRKNIEQLVLDKDLTDNIIFHGLQANVHDYLVDMDLFTLPSFYEGVSMSIVEAMGTGLPIVATRVGGVPNMVDETCGILTEVNTQEIADAFEKYYESKELREEHGKSAINKAELFSSQTMAEKYFKIYVG